jgi:NAD-dependent DNA ligase
MSNAGIEKAYMEICDDSINMYVPWYLMAAYAYYVQDDPILPDSMFDTMAKRMLEHWDEIQHRHKAYLTKEMLEAGTYIGDYPSQIKGAVESVRHAYR